MTTRYSTANHQVSFKNILLNHILRCGREERNVHHDVRRTDRNARNVLLTALIMKGTVLYDMTPCSLVEINDVSDEITTCTFRAGECPVCILCHEV